MLFEIGYYLFTAGVCFLFGGIVGGMFNEKNINLIEDFEEYTEYLQELVDGRCYSFERYRNVKRGDK